MGCYIGRAGGLGAAGDSSRLPSMASVVLPVPGFGGGSRELRLGDLTAGGSRTKYLRLSGDDELQEALKDCPDDSSTDDIAPPWRSASRGSNSSPSRTVDTFDVAPKWRSPCASSCGSSKADDRGHTCIVQFAAAIVYVEETEGVASVDVMRLGSMDGSVRVRYRTEDSSARRGRDFAHSVGELVFEDREELKTLKISITNSPIWSTVLEFKVHLEHPANCELGRYLHTSRVKIIDSDTFPSSKYAWELRQGYEGILHINGFSLFWEFWKLILYLKGNMWRTMVVIVMDQMQNLYLFYTLYVAAYLVNVVFNKEAEEDMLWFAWGTSSAEDRRVKTAAAIGALYILPLFVLHTWDYLRIVMDLRGRTRTFLQTSLFTKYLNYDIDSRVQVKPSDMQTTVMYGSDELAEGYVAMLEMFRIFGKVVVMVYFVFRQNPDAMWCVMVMPSLMFLWLAVRTFCLRKPIRSKPTMRRVTNLVSDTCTKYRLIANYFQRPRICDIFSSQLFEMRRLEVPEELHELTNRYFFKWLGPTFIGTYIYLQASQVLSGDLELGTFLATISVFKDIAENSLEGHDTIMKVARIISPLRDFSFFLNLPTDLLVWKRVNYERGLHTKRERKLVLSKVGRSRGNSRRTSVVKEEPMTKKLSEYPTDDIPIKLTGLSFGYTANSPFLSNVTLSIPQGKLIAISGPHGSGKQTLLRLLAYELFPTEGAVFIPTHLRVLHVSQESYILKGSLWHNLTFGCSSLRDIDVDRVQHVLRKLGIWSRLQRDLRDDMERHVEALKELDGHEVDGVEAPAPYWPSLCSACAWSASPRPAMGFVQGDDDWQNSLTYSIRLKIHLARALIMNPEVLVLQRPLHHYNVDEGMSVLKLLREYVENRGLCLPLESRDDRRPRTCFFTADASEHIMESDLSWAIRPQTKGIECVEASEIIPDFESLTKAHFARRRSTVCEGITWANLAREK